MKATQSRFLSVFRAAGVALLWLTMSVAGFQSAPAQDAASTPPGAFAGRLLAEHNRYRAAAGVPPLKWDAGLTADAEVYSRRLAVLGILVHSPRHRRNGSQGENLWRGTTGAFAPEAIVDNWGEERRWFHAGIYPDIASTHNWLDVVHYTQMTWPDSTKLGCGLSRTAQWDYLVCRYAPAGNIDGRRLP